MIRLAAPSFLPADRDRLDAVLASGQLVQGEWVAAFERRVSDVLDGVEVFACASGTAALHLAVLALDLEPGSEVVVPAFTWPSTAHVIVQAGCVPRFVDIDPETLNIDPAALRAAITPRVRALLPVHLFGIPAPMAAVMDVAAAHDLRVIEDAACALGTTTDAGPAGTIGDLACFSLHPRKIITTGEGGLVTTRSAALAERVRQLRNHGIVRDASGMRFESHGLNYRLTELQGVLGVGQMDQLEMILATRRRLAARYLDRLVDVPGVHIPGGLRDPGTLHQSFTVRVHAARRQALMDALRARGVETTIGTWAVAAQPVYLRSLGLAPDAYPHSVAAQHELLTLPLHHGMQDDDVDTVIETLRAVTAEVPA